jgi:hypothetical protein
MKTKKKKTCEEKRKEKRDGPEKGQRRQKAREQKDLKGQITQKPQKRHSWTTPDSRPEKTTGAGKGKQAKASSAAAARSGTPDGASLGSPLLGCVCLPQRIDVLLHHVLQVSVVLGRQRDGAGPVRRERSAYNHTGKQNMCLSDR